MTSSRCPCSATSGSAPTGPRSLPAWAGTRADDGSPGVVTHASYPVNPGVNVQGRINRGGRRAQWLTALALPQVDERGDHGDKEDSRDQVVGHGADPFGVCEARLPGNSRLWG